MLKRQENLGVVWGGPALLVKLCSYSEGPLCESVQLLLLGLLGPLELQQSHTQRVGGRLVLGDAAAQSRVLELQGVHVGGELVCCTLRRVDWMDRACLDVEVVGQRWSTEVGQGARTDQVGTFAVLVVSVGLVRVERCVVRAAWGRLGGLGVCFNHLGRVHVRHAGSILCGLASFIDLAGRRLLTKNVRGCQW